MNDRTLVKLRCNKEMLDIRTVSWTRKSPYSFSILRSELQQLEQRPQNRLISGDCGSFAVLRLTQRPGDMKMLEIRFTWLQEIGAGKVHGWQENIRLPYEPFHVFVENGEDIPKSLSIPLMVVYRYVPTILQEFCYVNESLKMRGLNLSVRNLKHLIPTIENYMVPLLFRSEKLSEELSAASLCKGLSVERNRSCCTEVKLTLADFLYLLGMAVVICGLLYLDFLNF